MQASPDHYNQETERRVKKVEKRKKREERSKKREERREKREKKTSTIRMRGSKDAMVRSQNGGMAQKRVGP